MSTTEFEDTKTQDRNNAKCCSWLRAELACHCCTGLPTTSMFDVVDAANQHTIDLNASFQLQATLGVKVYKAVMWGFVMASFIQGFSASPHPEFFMAYVTLWTYVYCMIYLTLSLILSFTAKTTTTTTTSSPSVLIKATWCMYLVACTQGIVVVLMFWGTEYDPKTYELEYFVVFSHACNFIIVWIDGWIINKIPVRLSHYVFSFGFGCLFVGWSIIQGLVPIDNPNRDDSAGTEALYTIMDWEQEPTTAIIASIFVLFLAFPFFTFVFWGLSLCGRRYTSISKHMVSSGNDQVNNDMKDQERSEEQQMEQGTAQVY